MQVAGNEQVGLSFSAPVMSVPTYLVRTLAKRNGFAAASRKSGQFFAYALN